MVNDWTVEVIVKGQVQVKSVPSKTEPGTMFNCAGVSACYPAGKVGEKTEYANVYVQVYGDRNIAEIQKASEGTIVLLRGEESSHVEPYKDAVGNVLIGADGKTLYNTFRKLKVRGFDGVKITGKANNTFSPSVPAMTISAAEFEAQRLMRMGQMQPQGMQMQMQPQGMQMQPQQLQAQMQAQGMQSQAQMQPQGMQLQAQMQPQQQMQAQGMQAQGMQPQQMQAQMQPQQMQAQGMQPQQMQPQQMQAQGMQSQAQMQPQQSQAQMQPQATMQQMAQAATQASSSGFLSSAGVKLPAGWGRL